MTQLGLAFDPPCTALVLQYGRIDCTFGESGIGWNGMLLAHCHRCLMAIAEIIAGTRNVPKQRRGRK